MEVAEEVRVRGAYMKRTRTVRSPRMTLRRPGHGGGLGARGRRGGGDALVQVRKHCRLRTYNRKIFCHNLTNILKYQKRNDQLSACQVVRSVSDWSCGQDRTEYSIVQALVATIAGAEHYVFIENQFFISHVKTGVAGQDVRNDSTMAAHERQVILLLLLSAF